MKKRINCSSWGDYPNHVPWDDVYINYYKKKRHVYNAPCIITVNSLDCDIRDQIKYIKDFSDPEYVENFNKKSNFNIDFKLLNDDDLEYLCNDINHLIDIRERLDSEYIVIDEFSVGKNIENIYVNEKNLTKQICEEVLKIYLKYKGINNTNLKFRWKNK